VGVGFNNFSPQAALDISDGSSGNQGIHHMKILGDALGSIESTTKMNLFYKSGDDFSINEGSNLSPWQTRFYISGGGNIGIGTTAPISKLEVESPGIPGISINNSFGFALAVKDNNGAKFAIWPTGDVTIGSTNIIPVAKLNINLNGTGQAISIYDDASTNINTKINFSVDNNGKTKIGANIPKVGGVAANAMLSVDGLILARDIRVAISGGPNGTHWEWPDYVFDTNYQLMTLNDIEVYISRNKHLPGILSEAEVKEEGVNLMQMNIQLLRKVEELYLHSIELKKQIDDQAIEIKKMKSK